MENYHINCIIRNNYTNSDIMTIIEEHLHYILTVTKRFIYKYIF